MEGFGKFAVFLIPTFLCLLASTQANVSKVQWVPSTEVDMSTLEPAGKEHDENQTLFVIRSFPNSSVIPGKYNEHSKGAYVAYQGQQLYPNNYEFLVAPPGTLSWVQASNKAVPIEQAIYGGRNTETLETLYICRAWYEDQWVIPGSYSYEEGVCSFPLHTERKSDRFEILVLNWYGELMDAGTGKPIPASGSKH